MALFNPLDREKLLKKTDAEKKLILQVKNFRDTNYRVSVETEGKALVLDHEQNNRELFSNTSSQLREKVSLSSLTSLADEIDQKCSCDTELPHGEMKEIDQDIEHVSTEYGNAVADWDCFREKSGLTRHAYYPDHRIKVLIVLVVIMLSGEMLLNSTFFALASDYGLVGGALVAFLVSAINLFLSFLISSAYRYVHHISMYQKAIGYFSVLLTLAAAMTLALFVGNYRTELERNPDNAGFDTVVRFSEDMFRNIDTVDSWILTGFTLVIFLISAFKFYRSDDPYPGYGAITRIKKNKEELFRAELIEALVQIDSAEEKMIRIFDKKGEEYKLQYQLIVSAFQKLEDVRGDYRSFLRRQEVAYSSFCQECRNIFSSKCMQMLKKQAYFSRNIELLELDDAIVGSSLNISTESEFEDIRTFNTDFTNNTMPKIREQYISNVNQFFNAIRERLNAKN